MPLNDADKEALDALFYKSPDEVLVDTADDIIETPVLVVDLDEVNEQAIEEARIITERLSGYYFDEKYIKEHPYIPAKIKQEIDMIRRLLKMLSVNEKAQDALIMNITTNAGKGSLYQSLTSLQNSTLNIQKQLTESVTNIENIFKEMQAECEKTFTEKPKEASLEDGSMIVRGSREFIKELTEKSKTGKINPNIQELDDGTKVNTETGEVVSDEMPSAEQLLAI